MAWLTGFSYRKSHVINSASNAGTNYQVKIVAHYGTGTDSGGDVYLNNHARNDFGDVRFTSSDQTTLLDYWMESYTASDKAVFWVEVADNLSSSPATIYIYYGKSDATTTSNGNNTFILFDDFDDGIYDTSKWTTVSGSPVESNGYLRIQGADVRSTNTVPAGHRQKARVRLNALTINSQFCWSSQLDGSEYQGWWCAIAGTLRTETYDNGGTHTESAFTPSLNTWYNYEYCWYVSGGVGQSTKFYVDNVLKSTHTTNIPDLAPYVGFLSVTNNPIIDTDWIFISKYVDPEPSHGSWGSEETSGQQVTRAVVEYLAGYDVKSRMASLHRVKTDYVGLLDSGFKKLGRNIKEYIGLLDSTIHSMSRYVYRTIIEYIGLLDIKSRISSLHRTLIEYLGLLDTKIRTVNLHRSFIEQLSVLESKVKSLSKTFTEYIGLYDFIECWKNITRRIITEFMGLKDTISKRKHLMRVFIEYVGVTETRIIKKTLHKIIVEYLGVKERYYRLPSFFKYFKWRHYQHPKQRVEVNS